MKEKTNLVFGKKNYTLMLAGLGVICLGFIIMSFNDAEKPTLGPLVLLAGFAIQFFAILAKDEAPKALETAEKVASSSVSTTAQTKAVQGNRKKRKPKK